MSKRNPIKSMSGNQWARLREYRNGHRRSYYILDATDKALLSRGLVEMMPRGIIHKITDLGRMVCDAYTEGQESTR